MKSFYRLSQYQFRAMAWPASILCCAAFLSPSLLLAYKLRGFNEYSVPERFENLLSSSGIILAFGMAMALMCLAFLSTFYSGYRGSKSIYTFLTLPLRRETLYFSKLLALAVWITVLCAAGLLGILAGYSYSQSRIGSVMNGAYLMDNALFLAFIRSGFLRVLLPLSLPGVLSTLAVAAATATGLFYSVLCERSRFYWGMAAAALAGWLSVHVISRRMDMPDFYPMIESRNTLLLFGFSIFFVWHSIRLLKKGEIS